MITLHIDSACESPSTWDITPHMLTFRDWQFSRYSASWADLPAISDGAATAQYADYDPDQDGDPLEFARDCEDGIPALLAALAAMLAHDGTPALAVEKHDLQMLVWANPEWIAQTGIATEHIPAALAQAAETYAAWANGDIYRWELHCPLTGDLVDSCGGYMGERDLPYAHQCAKEEARVHACELRNDHAQALHDRRQLYRQAEQELAYTRTPALAAMLAYGTSQMRLERNKLAQALRTLRREYQATALPDVQY